MGSLLAALSAVSVLATGVSADPAYQVMRDGDPARSCAALAEEIAGLNAEVTDLNAKADRKAARGKTGALIGKGLLKGLAANAGSLMYGGSSSALTGVLVSSAASGIAQQATAESASGPQAPAPREISPQQQRLTYLSDIQRQRPC